MPHATDAPTQPQALPSTGAPRVVLDTNVVLDWLLFQDAGCAILAGQLQSRQLIWCATPSMRGELASVLSRPQFQKWSPDCGHILSIFDRWASLEGEANPQPTAAVPRCRDPDDQKFIDLALAVGARWLFSRDRALLELARQSRPRGVDILTPVAWQHQNAAAPGSS